MATLAVLALIVVVLPANGDWETPLVALLLGAIVLSTLYEHTRRPRG